MSKKSALEYLKKLSKDEAFMKKVVSAKNCSARSEIIKKAGYSFTKDELKAALKEQLGKKLNDGKKLTDKELAEISGGRLGMRIARIALKVTVKVMEHIVHHMRERREERL